MKITTTAGMIVATALLALAAGGARAQETHPDAAAAPARTVPQPARGVYAQPWQQPPRWPAPPAAYGQPPAYYPQPGQYRAAPAAPVENPLDAKLRQAEEQLATKTAELDTTREQLARAQDKLRVATAALQKAQSDTVNAGIQVDDTMAQVDTLRKILCELAARIETRKAALHEALHPTEAEPDGPGSAAASEAVPETTEPAEPQSDPQCAQLTPPPAVTSGQRAFTVEAEVVTSDDQPVKPESAQQK